MPLDPYLGSMARNIWLVTALNDCKLVVKHIPGKHNIVADMLSRWKGTDGDLCVLHTNVKEPKWCEVHPEMLYIDTEI